MNWTAPRISPHFVGKLAAAIVIGLSASAAISRDPVSVPVAGEAAGVLAGAIGLAVGLALYGYLQRSSDCGSSGDCDC